MSRPLKMSRTMKSIAIFIVYFNNVDSVPPDYCLQPFNASDCNMKPTAVFSYYKSGSRCEIEYWRGCPTYNKFANEFECVDMCIYHFRGYQSQEKSESNFTNPDQLEEDLKDLPAQDLGQLDEIVDEVAKEVQKLSFHDEETEQTESETTIDPGETTDDAETDVATEEMANEEVATEDVATEDVVTEDVATEETEVVPEETTVTSAEKATTQTEPAKDEAKDSDYGLPEEIELP